MSGNTLQHLYHNEVAEAQLVNCKADAVVTLHNGCSYWGDDTYYDNEVFHRALIAKSLAN